MAGTLTASIIKNDTTSPPVFQNSAGTEIGTLCRAWVNFDGTTSPGTIRASYNVSSVTRNGTGQYTVNFTNAMVDTNYVTVASTSVFYNGFNAGNQGRDAYIAQQNTGSVLLETIITTTTVYQSLPYYGVAVFR